MTEGLNPLHMVNVVTSLNSDAALPVTTPLHRCEGCLQVFGSGHYQEDTFRCHDGCEGDFHAECVIAHHHEHEELRAHAAQAEALHPNTTEGD